MLSALVFSSLLAFTLSGPRPVAPLSFGPADVSSPIQVIVADGDTYVVFWIAENGEWPNMERHLMATRLTVSGIPTQPVLLTELIGGSAVSAARTPAGGFLVAWHDSEGRFVAPVDDSLQMGVPAVLPSGDQMTLACNAEGCLATIGRQGGLDAFAINPSDASVEAGPVRVATARYVEALAGSGSTFLLSYQEGATARILHLLDLSLDTISRRQTDVFETIAADRDGGYVLSTDTRISLLDANANITVQRTFDIDAGHHYIEEVQVTASDEGYAVAAVVHDWHGTIPGPPPVANVVVLRFRRDLSALDPEPIVVVAAGSNHSAHLTSNGRTYVAGWNQLLGGRVGLLRAIPLSGSSDTPMYSLRSGPLHQRGHAIARSATSALAVWDETDIGRTAHIKAVRLTRDGGALDMKPIEIGAGVGRVVAGSDSRNFLVAWQTDRSGIGSFKTALVDSLTGDVSAKAAFLGSPGTSLLSDGESFFLPVSRGSHLVVARFAATGDFITEFTVDTATHPNAAIAYAGGRLLVAYSRVDGRWARAFTLDGHPLNEALQLPGSGFDAVIVGNEDGFIVAQESNWFTSVTLQGRLVRSQHLPDLRLRNILGGWVVNGRPAFFGNGRDGFQGVLFFDGSGTLPRLLELENAAEVRAITGGGHSLLLLRHESMDGVTRVMAQQVSFGDPVRRRAIRR